MNQYRREAAAMHGLADMVDGKTMPEDTASRCVQEFRTTCESMKMQVAFRRSSLNEWDRFLSAQPYIPIAYANDFVEYQLAWSEGSAEWLRDISVIIYLDGKAAAVWPLCLRSSTKGIEIGSNEGPLFPPLMSSGLSPRSKKKAYARSYELILGLSAKLRTDGWKGVETIFMQDGLSDWHMMQMDGGASLSVKHDLYLDLSLDLSEIKSRMRKSYRSLITSGERLWVTDVLRVPDRRVWQEFQSLHLNVAGRQTRSQKTWDLQLHSIALGNGFLVMLRDDQGCPVGGGFFQHTRDEALYSVGAYDRSLFDKPLGHLVQWTAIKELRQLGVRWYRIGERAYRSDDDFRHEKMITISHFKEGFSTHCFLRALTSNKSARVCAGDGVAAVND